MCKVTLFYDQHNLGRVKKDVSEITKEGVEKLKNLAKLHDDHRIECNNGILYICYGRTINKITA